MPWTEFRWHSTQDFFPSIFSTYCWFTDAWRSGFARWGRKISSAAGRYKYVYSLCSRELTVQRWSNIHLKSGFELSSHSILCIYQVIVCLISQALLCLSNLLFHLGLNPSAAIILVVTDSEALFEVERNSACVNKASLTIFAWSEGRAWS